MSDVNEHLERLIVRRLDGALSEAEQLELNREFLRCPDARRLLDEYRRVDELASAALHSALPQADGDGEALDVTWISRRVGVKAGRVRRWGWLYAGSAVAAMLAIAVGRFGGPAGEPIAFVNRSDHGLATPQASGDERSWAGLNGLLRDAADGPRIRRSIDRDLFGVIAENGNVYWLEVDHTTTMKRSGERGVGPF